MVKKFDIHEWQAKRLLAEQEEFTPDLEDDDLKRSKIQQMMNTEKGLQKDDYKLVNSISNVAEMYSYGEILDALESFYIKNDEQQSAEMVRKHAQEFREFLGPDEEEDPYDALTSISDNPDDEEKFMGDWGPHLAEEDLDENMTGTGASFNAGVGMGHFGKSKKKRVNTPSGDMAYTQNVSEQEEPPIDDTEEEDEDTVDTATELSNQFKSLANDLKSPAGQRGFEKKEIVILSDFMDQLVTSVKDGNASSLLNKLNNLVN